jgi:hypothetical protein
MKDNPFEEAMRALGAARRAARRELEEARRQLTERMAASRAELKAREEAILAQIEAMRRDRKRRRPGKDRDAGGVPVKPNRPKNLEGGAAVALDFGTD